jgi:murein DD-endopeptidase MepM/ murein hydrolase activator NlpD
MGSAIHFGIDLVKPTGTPIASCAAGKVVMAKTRIISGETVVLEHAPGVFSLYYHLDSIAVKQGETVEAGETIGTVGATGLVTGAHLHWEVRFSGVPVSPGYLLEHNLLDKQSILSIISPD